MVPNLVFRGNKSFFGLGTFQRYMELSLRQKIVLMINKRVFIGYEVLPNWEQQLPMFLIQCRKCKMFYIDYYINFGIKEFFECPNCRERISVIPGFDKLARCLP